MIPILTPLILTPHIFITINSSSSVRYF